RASRTPSMACRPALAPRFAPAFPPRAFAARLLNMWTNVGFSTACGSAGIYADSAVSFAPLVNKWASEATFAETVQLANSVGDVADNVSKAYYNANGKPDKAARVDSTRTIGGNG